LDQRRRTDKPHYAVVIGSVTITIEVGTNGATPLSRMNFSGYVGHVTIFSWMFTIVCCLAAVLGFRLDFVCLVTGYSHVFVLLSAVIVKLLFLLQA